MDLCGIPRRRSPESRSPPSFPPLAAGAASWPNWSGGPKVAGSNPAARHAWQIPQGSYFALGDNRAESCDSRVWGSVPARNVIGPVVKVLRGGQTQPIVT